MSNKFIVPKFNFNFGDGFSAYDYQIEAFNRVFDHIRESDDPAYIYASVSAGKSLLIAMIAKHFQNVNEAAKMQGFKSNHQVLMIVRTGELVKQNAEEAWDIGCKNSIWCSSLIPKSHREPPAFKIIMGSEQSVYNSINNDLGYIRPTILLLDEAHSFAYDNEDSVLYKTIEILKERNPKIKIIGLTGSPWRGRESIINGGFWKKELIKIDRPYLTKRGFVMPVEFGFGTGETHYDSLFDNYSPEEDGNVDFSDSQLAAMEARILEEGTRTQLIMLDVMKKMQNRNVALITCSGRKHCDEAAKYLPKGSYAIIDKDTPVKQRLLIKEKCNNGELKYVLQIGTWTVGVSIPRIDTIVIMRLIGSMTLYEQLIGRGVRKLKKHDVELGIIKNECLVLDYTDTSAIMAELFSSDELDKAEKKRAEQNDEDMIECPKCHTLNSPKARRCCGDDGNGDRCDFFFSSKICEDMYDQRTGLLIKKGCGAENDPSARVCRCCHGFMKDPNENLINTAYSKDQMVAVKHFAVGLTKDGSKIVATYKLDKFTEKGRPVTAREIFDVTDRSKKFKIAKWREFVNAHISNKTIARKVAGIKDPKAVMEYAKLFQSPTMVTHRVNDNKWDIIARKEF